MPLIWKRAPASRAQTQGLPDVLPPAAAGRLPVALNGLAEDAHHLRERDSAAAGACSSGGSWESIL